MKKTLTAGMIRQDGSYKTELLLSGSLKEKGYDDKTERLLVEIPPHFSDWQSYCWVVQNRPKENFVVAGKRHLMNWLCVVRKIGVVGE